MHFMRYERYFFLTALVVYIVAAWFSTGFYHGDEHYQLIEFAAYKMGTVSPEGLAWEFSARVETGPPTLHRFHYYQITAGIFHCRPVYSGLYTPLADCHDGIIQHPVFYPDL